MTGKVAAKLTRDQFGCALAHGRGAALMHVLEHGIAEVEDLLIQACVDEQSYDPQCEGHRAAWLYRFFKGSPRCPQISTALLAKLAFDQDEPCCEQLCEIAALMAIDGDAAAASALREYVWSQDAEDEALSGARAISMLDGVAAVVKIARRHGNILLAAPDGYVDGLDYLLDSASPAHAAAVAELEQVARADTAVAAFLNQHRNSVTRDTEPPLTDEEREARRAAYIDERARKMPVEQILKICADAGRRSNFALRSFGRFARPGDLDIILRYLGFETEAAVCKNLLRIFFSAEMPRMHPRVWELAHDDDTEMRNLAARALSTLTDSRVGDLGRERLQAPDLSPADHEFLRLFALNLKPGDENLILSALSNLELDADATHAFGSSIMEILKKNDAPALARWLYDTNPCTICREWAVAALLKTNALPEDVAEECRHDASDDIRALVGAPAH